MNQSDTPHANIQGLIFHGYSKFKSAHLLFRFPETKSAEFPNGCDINGFVKAIFSYVESAQPWGKYRPVHFINIAFSFDGLKRASVPSVEFDLFPLEFRLGPTNYYSQQTLCDLGKSAPSNWDFGNGDENKKVHCIVHCYGMSHAELDMIIEIVSKAAISRGVIEVFASREAPDKSELSQSAPKESMMRFRSTSDLESDFIHLGYRDGINDPLRELSANQVGQPGPEKLMDFIIGYPGSPISPGPSFESDPNNPTGIFTKDGIYSAFRIFYLDVKAFEGFLEANADKVMERLRITRDNAKEWLAAKLNGRWKGGSPLVLSPDVDQPENHQVFQISYQSDKDGIRCPFSSHTRVTNPRDGDIFRTESPIPGVLRRGVSFGLKPSPPHFEGEQGLIGIFLCGSIGEQFEKLYSWINRNNFSKDFTEPTQDPLVANRETPGTSKNFIIPMEGGKPLVLDLDGYQFVVTRGTVYAFMRSLNALETIAETKV
jgi:hypothetical protein